MSQHDYNIANASFPTVRTDINNVLSAINSTNSGSSRPSSAVAGTIWLDTSGAATAQLLKMYDGAADILLGTVNFTANTIDWSDSAITLGVNSVDSDNYVDGSIDTAHIADGQVTLAKLAADSVNATKIADDAISEEHLDVTSITGHTAETSIADGDTILIHDASASALRKMTKANFVSGIGGANTPAFEATLGGSQAVSDGVITKLTFTSETFDSDGTFASSRFTPAVAGTYFVYFKGLTDPAAYANERDSSSYFYKNGSNSGGFQTNFMTGGNASADGSTAICHTNHGIFVLDDNDYIEVYGAVNTHNGSDGNFKKKVFGGYRIII